eukprot:185261_1
MTLPFSLSHIIPKPLFHPIYKNCIVISTYCRNYHQRYTSGIYIINLDTNELRMIGKYEQTFKPYDHGQFIDPSNNTLIVFGNGVYGVFDLNTHKMKETTHNNMLKQCKSEPQTKFIPSICGGNIHVFTRGMQNNHYQFNIGNKKTKKLKIKHKIYCPKLTYIKSHKKLYMFDSHNKTIFQYHGNKWNICKLQMICKEHRYNYDIVNGFRNVLFVFYWKRDEIHILDALLWYKTPDLSNAKWYKTKYNMVQLKNSCLNVYAFQTDDQQAHIIDFSNNIHIKINLYNIIPNEMIISHRKYYKTVIMGYIRDCENKLSLFQPIAHVIKILTLNYFQLFS